MRRVQGFTLLELLIAIAIFALLGLATYRMLDSVMQTDKVTRAHEAQLRELLRGMAAFERDVVQVIARPVRDPFGESRAALIGEDLNGAVIELTRSGWRNPLEQPRSNLQRVRWQLSGEQWQRRYWTVLDQAQDSQPQIQQALTGVTEVRLRYMDKDHNWQETWPPPNSSTQESLTLLPQAIELRLQHERYGELYRLIRLPEGIPEKARQAGGTPPDEESGEAQPEVPQT
ncbi:type II secretion system minor pseudopilin GspJ [Ectopseudomonas mendocina]|uniref:Type II secretion system protein J n=1 Tax=Ectopseudomonas mendocina TaxID=300 RepID=A0ABZ2RDB0_ECTME